MRAPQADCVGRLQSPPYRIGLGTYRLGRETMAACLTALSLGYRHVDTASLYRNEEAIGQAILLSGIHQRELFITSKVWIKDAMDGSIPESIERSLRYLGKIDLMLLHGPTLNLAEDWSILCEASDMLGIPSVGVSNFQELHLQQLLGRQPAVNQIEITPFLPQVDLVKYCHDKGILVTAHSPLAKGRRFTTPVLEAIASSHDATIPQVMLAWSLAKGHIPLPRSRDENHLRQNFEAQKLILSRSEIDQLDGLKDGYATHPRYIKGVELSTSSRDE